MHWFSTGDGPPGDLREEPAFSQIVGLVPEREVDLVLSDMAPNLSGMDAIDPPRPMYLVELALETSKGVKGVLKPDGATLIKVFQGAGFEELVAATRRKFAKVKLCKPEGSRSAASEVYLLAKGFRLV